MKIGDIFWEMRGESRQLQVDAKKAGTKAGDTASKSFGAKFKAQFSKQKLGEGILQGFGLGLGFGAFSLASRAVGGLTDALGGAVDAANEEAAAIAQLNTSIEENDAAWDGNIGRVEGVINARQRLGFADDEQRESLRQLVAVTKDHQAALDLQRTAMDLARLKGISLASASTLLGKVYAGNTGALTRQGIVLRKGATATEAIAEVQKRAAGQADTWADENVGAAKRAEIAWGNVQENVGGLFTDMQRGFDEFSTFAAEGINDLFPGPGAEMLNARLGEILKASEEAGEDQVRVIDIINDGLRTLNIDLLPSITRVNRVWGENEEAARSAGLSFTDVESAVNRLDRAWALAGFEGEDKLKATDAVMREIIHSLSMAPPALKETGQAFTSLEGPIGRATQGVIRFVDKAVDGAEEVRDLADEVDLAKGSFKSFWESIREQQRRVEFFIRNPDKLKEELGKIDAAIERAEEKKSRLMAVEGRKRNVAAIALIDQQIRDLKAKADEWRAIGIVYGNSTERGLEAAFDPKPPLPRFSDPIVGGRKHHYTGSTLANVPYLTGESGHEQAWMASVPGKMWSAPDTREPTTSPVGSGGGTVINLTTNGQPVRAETPAEQVRQFRRGVRLGILEPTRRVGWGTG